MPIWYLKRPGRREDRGTGPGIFFGGPELPEKPPERKTRKCADRCGGGGPPSRRYSPFWPINWPRGPQFDSLSLC
ncbi:hypothetical protein JCGZ_06851 [Jatropha curcas]|uniref:Uncharacterized protein n=1 Tax=Jatropha curcas TaxID=180498 RepID=A0A067JK21_JATCU|nr:hypothetical protein JCGZ_06851 [Jatropha curcas]